MLYTISAFFTLLVGQQERHPACKKTEWWGVGVVICLQRSAHLHMAQLMPLPLTVSCFSKIQIGSAFLVTLVEFHTVKTCPGAMQSSLTDYELVILALRTCTCLQAKIYQHVSFAVFHSLLITYFWNVAT